MGVVLQTTTLRFRCFGQFELLGANGWKLGPSHKGGREFLEYLACHPHSITSRETLIDAFWPDVDFEVAAHRLHQAASGARTALQAAVPELDPIQYTGGCYGWHPAITIETDAMQLDEYYKEGSVEAFEHAVDLYTGELLAGESAEWVLRRRLHFAYEFVGMLERLALDAFERKRYDVAAEYALRLSNVDPAHEDAARLAMRCFANLGRRSLALAEYETLRQYLRKYLSVLPTQQTEDLRRHIAKGDQV